MTEEPVKAPGSPEDPEPSSVAGDLTSELLEPFPLDGGGIGPDWPLIPQDI